MAEEVKGGPALPHEGRIGVSLEELGIQRCDDLSPAQEEEMQAAGFNLDAILAGEGITAEALHDAMFLTEQIARTTLGTNYERIVASVENYCRMVSILRPSKVVDLGGGCGITCFDAAATSRDCQFTICDRSRNALEIGSRWAERIGLTNVLFQRLDFGDADVESLLGRDNDLVVFEFVFSLGFELEDESEVIAHTSPGLKTGAGLLNPTGKACVRFGEFSEHGLTGLIRAAYRSDLFVHSIAGSERGFTFLFGKENCENSEDAEVFCAMDDLGSQIRAMDPGE